MTTAAYRAALDRIARALLRLLLPLLRAFFRAGLEKESVRRRRVARTSRLVVGIVRASRRQVAEVTGEFLQAQGADQGYSDVWVPPLSGYSEQAVRTVLESAAEEHVDKGTTSKDATESVSSTFVRHVEQAGRQMIVDAVEPVDGVDDVTVEEHERTVVDEPDDEPDDDDGRAAVLDDLPEPIPFPEQRERQARKRAKARPVAYARVLTGAENCAFCVMLASRGAVYKDESTALGDELRPDQRGVLAYRYHDNCDCVAVPIFTSKAWEYKDQADELYEMWLRVTDGYKQRDAINALRRYLEARRRAGEPIIPNFRPLRREAA